MNENHHVLRWPAGLGWLVFSGGSDGLSTIRAQVLRKAKPEGEVVYIGLSVDDADEIMEDLGELGAPTGYLVDILTQDDDTIHREIKDAAVIVLPDDHPAEKLQGALMGVAIDAIREAYDAGAIVLAEARSAVLFGGVYVSEDDVVTAGLNWLEDTYIIPGVTSMQESELARSALATQSAAVVVGIGIGSALALGPDGQVETWGKRQVALGLGTNPSDR